ncbi:hypothetical protein AVEN_186360-1 [Araneus ventricosus]|uniref:SOCS box domain-containing protein n=1 Tax=Araneus ventricosus TaxID=182803 RepID=A0A4Y2W8V3_ARAVE|nr:hypothetical protein AVEN_186360-1 [Araneus ventricosus]
METWMKPERIYLLLQMFWFLRNGSRRRYIIYFRRPEKRPLAAATECLRLIWSSIPSPLLSFREVYLSLEGALSHDERAQLYCCYAVIVGGFHLRVRPRSLKHLSRTAVRSIMWKNGHYLPDGIRNAGLPKELQEYLNLGCDRDPFEKVDYEVHNMRNGFHR